MLKVNLYFFLLTVLIAVSKQFLEEDIIAEMNNSSGVEKSLSRRRRYLVFPSGSSLQLVYCLTVPSLGMGTIFTLGHTAALAWELPDKAEFILDLKKNKFHQTTTEAPETTTMPNLHMDHDFEYDFGHDYDPPHQYHPQPPLERLDRPPKYPYRWDGQHNKRPPPVNNRKTYYNPFFINKTPPTVFGFSPIKTVSNQAANGQLHRNSITVSRRKGSYESRNRNTINPSNNYNQWIAKKPVSSYIHPVYHQHYRRTRRDLYGKIENLFTALSKDGKACLLKAVCEVSQVAERKGTFMEEIIKAIFRVKPHDSYPSEDEYDNAANKDHNCVDKYPTCDGSIWRSMLEHVVLCGSSGEESTALSRQKRFLLFPPDVNIIQLIIGIGVPLELKSHAVVFGWGFRAVYFLPMNLSELMPMDVNERKKRSVSRWDVYQMLEQMSEMRGLGGRDCILRAICEAADTPIDKYNGFFEELFHTLFTPSSTNEEISQHRDNQYLAAQELGRKNKGMCTYFFPECKHTLLDVFTRFNET